MELVTYKIYLLVDSFGNKTSIVVGNIQEDVTVEGLKDVTNNPLVFINSPICLEQFCQENNISLRIVEKIDFFAELWFGNKTTTVYDSKKSSINTIEKVIEKFGPRNISDRTQERNIREFIDINSNFSDDFIADILGYYLIE